MRCPPLAVTLLLASLAAAPTAEAQRFGFEPLPGITITASTGTVAVDAGQSATLAFHVAYNGTAPLDAMFFAREVGGFGGGFRNGTRPDGGPRFNGTGNNGGPRNGTRPSFPPGGFPGGGRGRRGGNVTATADPAQATLQPGDEGDVTLTVTVAAAAAPGSDHRMAFLVRSGNRTAMQAFTVHVNGPAASSAHPSPAAGLGALAVALGTAFVARRRRR